MNALNEQKCSFPYHERDTIKKTYITMNIYLLIIISSSSEADLLFFIFIGINLIKFHVIFDPIIKR